MRFFFQIIFILKLMKNTLFFHWILQQNPSELQTTRASFVFYSAQFIGIDRIK